MKGHIMQIKIKELVGMSQDLKLLYVEDDENARKTTLKLLKNFFKDITTAVDGQDGLDKFRADKFDLIISDINMPRLSGMEMLKIIRDENSNISVLMLSAHNDGDYFMRAIELDVDGYILKPLAYEQFTKALFKIAQKIKLLKLQDNYQKNLEEEVEKRNKEIEHKLYFDYLTNLSSRYSFFKDIKKFVTPVVLLINIDKFRTINEVYGSSVGSKVLIEFARFLESNMSGNLFKFYRLSSDEFAIIDTVHHIEPEKYEEIIENFFTSLRNFRINIEDNIISLSVTMGLSTVDKDIYESAKIALDFAKKHKTPFVMYSTAIDYREESSLTLKRRDDIVSAISDNRVVAVYQPIVDMQRKTVKHEILMRLREKESGKLISPFFFLDIAIKTRLYDELSSTIIFEALKKLDETDHTLSMNFTYSDIKNRPFMQKIEDYLVAHKGIGERAVFEITEGEGIDDYSDVKKFIKRFKKHGVKFAIDDFGSGFSNFEYILEIEPDYLKIDGSLIKDMDKDARAYVLVEAIVRFSHKLGIKIIAEYVHSEVIFEMLKKLHVDEYQGFYFSEPLEQMKKS